MKKHLRIILLQLAARGIDATVNGKRSNGHVILSIERGERRRTMAVANTPTVIEHTIHHAVKEAERLLEEAK